MATTARGEIIRAGKGAEHIGAWINDNLDQIAKALPRGAHAERMARVFCTELQRVPKLIQCTPASLIGGFLQAAQCGLEIGSHMQQAWLVPFRNHGQYEATLIFGYKGLVTLAHNSGLVSDAMAMDVRKVDEYDPPELGTSPKIRHRPKPGRQSSPLVACYSVVRLRGSSDPHVEWMWPDEIASIKSKSRGAAQPNSPWSDPQAEPFMWRKTALRRNLKTVPASAEARQLTIAINNDDAADDNREQAFDFAGIKPPEIDYAPPTPSDEDLADLRAPDDADGAA